MNKVEFCNFLMNNKVTGVSLKNRRDKGDVTFRFEDYDFDGIAWDCIVIKEKVN